MALIGIYGIYSEHILIQMVPFQRLVSQLVVLSQKSLKPCVLLTVAAIRC